MAKPSYTIEEAAAHIDRAGVSWISKAGETATVTFAFRDTLPLYEEPAHKFQATFKQSSSAFIDAALQALELWSDVADINFARVGSGNSGKAAYSDDATILIASYSNAEDGAAGAAYLPESGKTGPDDREGDVWIDTVGAATNPTAGDYTFYTFLHEIGHALGLKHPGEYNAQPGQTLSYDKHAEFKEDTRQYSLMSYFDAEITGAKHKGSSASTPLLTDIHAIQLIYGANTETRTGDTTYGFNSNADRAVFKITSDAQEVVFAIWDAGGEDTLDASGYGTEQTLDLRPGKFSSLGGLVKNVAMAVAPPNAGKLDYFIENAIGGTFQDTLIGSDRANKLQGGDGNDIILGAARIDTLIGGEGFDQIQGGDGDDVIEGNEGNDILEGGADSDTAIYTGTMLDYDIIHNGKITTVSHVKGLNGIDRLIGIEFLEFDGKRVNPDKIGVLHGDGGKDYLYGYWSQTDFLSGGGGNDYISGDQRHLPDDKNPRPTGDTLNGDAGDDTINGGGGGDRVFGGGGNDDIFGGTEGGNRLYGEAGDDGIVGGLDEKADVLEGGEGNDGLVIIARHEGISDVVRGGNGDDSIGMRHVHHGGSLYGRKLEGENGNDRLHGGAGDDTLEGGAGNDYLEDSGFESSGNNRFYGGDNNDTLVGAFSFGVDTFDGGAGNDLILNVSRQDKVRGGTGLADFMSIDRSTSALGFTLDLSEEIQLLVDNTSIVGIEYMSFSGGSGKDVLKGLAGGKLLDTLIGNAGNDILDGGGGADTVIGGPGSDTLYVNRADDVVVERAEKGQDVIRTSVSYTLEGTAVENLVVQNQKGTENLDLTGNELANQIIANNGDNTLKSGPNGLFGADILFGGGGNDVYELNFVHIAKEAAGRGTDRIILFDTGTGNNSYRSYTLLKGSEIEFLEARTTYDFNLTGNEFANTITGNNFHNKIEGGAGDDVLNGLARVDTLEGGSGADVLSGGVDNDFLEGGAGKDTLVGGDGDDTYVIDDELDVVVEDLDVGSIDEVQAYASHTLAPGVEILRLLDEDNDTGLGNASDNRIYGIGNDCTIDGLGGSDTLYGKGGVDNFRFSTEIGTGGYDILESFVPGEDNIVLSRAIFTGLTKGTLASDAFVIGTKAADANDRIIYNPDNGNIFFDADGSKDGSSYTFFALVRPNLNLSNFDFEVY